MYKQFYNEIQMEPLGPSLTYSNSAALTGNSRSPSPTGENSVNTIGIQKLQEQRISGSSDSSYSPSQLRNSYSFSPNSKFGSYRTSFQSYIQDASTSSNENQTQDATTSSESSHSPAQLRGRNCNGKDGVLFEEEITASPFIECPSTSVQKWLDSLPVTTKTKFLHGTAAFSCEEIAEFYRYSGHPTVETAEKRNSRCLKKDDHHSITIKK